MSEELGTLYRDLAPADDAAWEGAGARRRAHV